MKRHVKTMMAAVLLVAMAFVIGCKKTDDPNNGGNNGGDIPEPGEVINGPDLMTFTVNGVSFDMVKVEGGTFWMGAQSENENGQNYDNEANDAESPVHQVALSDYYIGKYEVSQELWQAVMGTNPSYFQGTLLPVENVGPNSVQDFLHTLNARLSSETNGLQFRLPSEAQWEYAAKGGKESHGYKYSGNNNANVVAWYSSNSSNQTHPIGSKEPNELFVYDMSGNVAEWCNDYVGGYVGVSQTDPIGPSQEFMGENPGWIVRGGSWKGAAVLCRSSSRDGWNKGENLIGFRLVLCGNVGQATVPGPKTGNVSDVTTNSAYVTGALWTDGGSYQTEWGFCYGTSLDLATNGTKISVSEYGNNHDFSVTLTNLQPGTKYYVCAYAKNAIGTGYGEAVEFITRASVITSEATEIAINRATCGGVVLGNENDNVIRRGICWNTQQNPTIESMYTDSGTGTGEFTALMTNLTFNTTYYVRAFAINARGIVSYGNEVSFTTLTPDSPTVTTLEIHGISSFNVKCSGSVINDGGAIVTERGFCWGTSPNPTLNDDHLSSGSGLGSFEIQIDGLMAGTTYYFRAYAVNCANVGYGNDVSFITQDVPVGALKGVFSISPTQQVFFSQGNLQYQASTNTWRFAEHQYDFVGEGNSNISSVYSGWIDLFGWGTSGYNHGAVCYQPWSTSQVESDYYAYGSSIYNLFDQTGQADWGYNPISNGGNQEGIWHTLSREEWVYLIGQRNTASGILYVIGRVGGVDGVILLPDSWNSSIYYLTPYEPFVTFSSNIISQNIWNTVMEPSGAVFIPAAGDRYGNHFGNSGFFGCWTSTRGFSFMCESVFGIWDIPINEGLSVRLVCPAD